MFRSQAEISIATRIIMINRDYSRLIVISATVSRIALKVLLCVYRPLGTSRVSPTICPLWGTKTCTPPPPRLSASSWRTWPITYEFAEFVSPLFFFLCDRNHFSHLYIYLSKAEIEGDRMFFDVNFFFSPYIFLFLQERQQLLSLAASKITNLQKKNLDDKFIICLNKVSKHFPPFMDRWVHSFPCSINQFIIDFNIVDFGILFIFTASWITCSSCCRSCTASWRPTVWSVCWVEPRWYRTYSCSWRRRASSRWWATGAALTPMPVCLLDIWP